MTGCHASPFAPPLSLQAPFGGGQAAPAEGYEGQYQEQQAGAQRHWVSPAPLATKFGTNFEKK